MIHGNNLACLPKSGAVTGNISHKSNDVVYPNLDLAVLIVGNCFRSGAIAMFAQAGCRAARDVADADLICFLGGEDVDPALYGEKVLRGTYFNRARDDVEMEVYLKARDLEKPMFGICRGMQFLHVMNGGKLYQHVSNHAGANHDILDVTTGEVLPASSMHHQMCILDDTTKVIATAKAHSGFYAQYGTELSSNNVHDLEACWWPEIGAIGVQGHPEVSGLPEYTAWCLRKVQGFLAADAVDDPETYTINPASLPPAIN